MSTYYIDIDGVLCSNTWGLYSHAKPLRDNIKAVRELYADGHRIVLWTARGATTGTDWRKLTEEQMANWGVPYHELKLDKPHYDYIVDDKCTVLPQA